MKLKPIAPNQTEIHFNDRLADRSKQAIFFFSYGTPVAAKIGTTYYRCEDKFSQTTTRHTNSWLEDVQYEVKPQTWFEKALLIPYGEEARAHVIKNSSEPFENVYGETSNYIVDDSVTANNPYFKESNM